MRSDPLIAGSDGSTDLMLDRYLAYRKAMGDPVARKALVLAARYAEGMGGFGQAVARSILTRARRAPTTGSLD